MIFVLKTALIPGSNCLQAASAVGLVPSGDPQDFFTITWGAELVGAVVTLALNAQPPMVASNAAANNPRALHV
jgi:hypothetical protein